MPKQDLPAHTIQLKHINAAYVKHATFQHMIQDAIAPLQAHAQYDLYYAWDTLVHCMQHVIKVYGGSFMADWRRK